MPESNKDISGIHCSINPFESLGKKRPDEEDALNFGFLISADRIPQKTLLKWWIFPAMDERSSSETASVSALRTFAPCLLSLEP